MRISKSVLHRVVQCRFLRAVLERIDRTQCGREILNSAHPTGIYEDFAEAWSRARSIRAAGHEHQEAWKLHLQVAQKLRHSDYPVLDILAHERSERLRVFDFGGSIGNLYYLYRRFLEGHAESLDWTVFDLPQTIAEGQRLTVEMNARNLRFTSSCQEFTADQILLASGAFHYWE